MLLRGVSGFGSGLSFLGFVCCRFVALGWLGVFLGFCGFLFAFRVYCCTVFSWFLTLGLGGLAVGVVLLSVVWFCGFGLGFRFWFVLGCCWLGWVCGCCWCGWCCCMVFLDLAWIRDFVWGLHNTDLLGLLDLVFP